MIKKLMVAVTVLLTVAACTTESDNRYPGGIVEPGGGQNESGTVLIGDLTSFDIKVDSTLLTGETEVIPADDEDYIENNSFTTVVTVKFREGGATVDGIVDGVEVTASDAHVTVNSTIGGVQYVLSGTTGNGSFKVYSGKKYSLRLAGVDITNPTGAAINCQSGKRCYLVVADGTFNRLADGATYSTVDGEDMKGVLFAEGKLLMSGEGRLRVYGKGKHGLVSDDYILFRPGADVYVKAEGGSGIKANDGIYVRGGVINAETSATAAKALTCDGEVVIDGGRTTLLTSGGGEWDDDDQDVKGCAGIKADLNLTINGGSLLAKSTGAGGKGLSSDAEIIVNGGDVKVITTGASFVQGSYDTKAKGVKADGNLTVNGGTITIRTTGGDGSEGLESKGTLTVNDGTIQIYSSDDAINSAGDLIFNGGKVFAYSTGNDAIDSNSTLAVNGGVVIACGATSPEGGFDCDNSSFAITGGTIIGLGGDTSVPTTSAVKQPAIVLGGANLKAGTYLTLSDANGNNLYAFSVPRAYSQYTLLTSAPGLKTGSKFTLSTGATVNGGTSFLGYVTGGAVTGGTSIASQTISSGVTTIGYSGMNGGGGPGGPGGMGGGFHF